MTPGDFRRPVRWSGRLAIGLWLILAGIVGCQARTPANGDERGSPGSGDLSPPGPSATTVAEGENEVLRIPIPSDPGSLNPLLARQARQTQFSTLFYPSLLRSTPRGAAVPSVEGDLARWWRWDAPARTLTCGLRLRLWEDTTRVSARDVVRTYEAYEALGWLARRAPGDSLPDAGLVSAQAIDDSTVRLTYRPGVSFWRALGAASWPVLPARKLGDLKPPMLQANPLGREPLSAGAFRLSDWRSGLNLWMSPHPFASGGRRAPYDRVEFDVCPGVDARILRVRMGRADIVLDVPVDQLASLVEPGAPVYLHRAGVRSVEMLLWNLRVPRAGTQIREALSLAVDRTRIVQTLLTWRGEACGGPAGGLLEPEGPPADSIDTGILRAEPAGVAPAAPVLYAPMPRLDRAAADSALDAAGWGDRDAEGFRVRDGQRLRLEVLYDRANLFREQLATLLESDLARVGIELVPVPVDGGQFWGRVREGSFVTALAGFRAPDVPDPSALWASWGYWNGTGYASVRVDSLCVELAREEDPARRLRQVRTIESLVRSSGPVTFLVYRDWAALLHNRVEGFEGIASDPLRSLERVRLAARGPQSAQETLRKSRVPD